MIKTVTLTAGEVNSVEFGQRYPYYYIKNFSSYDVYASIRKFVFVADAEEVTRIPAGSTGIVYGTLASEYVNILCAESVKIEIIGAFSNNVNFLRKINTGGGNVVDAYTKEEANRKITEKVAEIVAAAPEDFNTLKEISTWIETHEDSAASMNVKIQENTSNISKKVDKKDGYSLASDVELARLANVHNYDDTNIKAQNYTTSVKSMTNTMCGFKFDTSVNRFTAKFLMCGNNENRYADIFINVCFGKAKIKKYILDNMTSIQIIKTEDNAINIVFNVEQYTTVTCVSTVPMTMITCYSASTLPTGTEITPTEL